MFLLILKDKERRRKERSASPDKSKVNNHSPKGRSLSPARPAREDSPPPLSSLSKETIQSISKDPFESKIEKREKNEKTPNGSPPRELPAKTLKKYDSLIINSN